MPGTFSLAPRDSDPTCGDAWQDRLQAVSFEVGSGENVPGIPGACATHNFTYLLRGQFIIHHIMRLCNII